MTRVRSLITAVFATVALVGGGAAYAQVPLGGGPPGSDSPNGRVERFGPGPGGIGLPLRALNLTDAQKTQVQAVLSTHREAMRGARDRVRMAMDAQRDAVQSVPINEGLIRSTTGELAEAQTQAAIEAARLNSEVVAVLTPAQQAQLKTLRAERATRASQRSNNRRRR